MISWKRAKKDLNKFLNLFKPCWSKKPGCLGEGENSDKEAECSFKETKEYFVPIRLLPSILTSNKKVF